MKNAAQRTIGRIRRILRLARYFATSTIQEAWIVMWLHYNEFSHWEGHPRRRRLTSLEMADQQAFSATNSFSQAVLHVCVGCGSAIQAGLLYLSFFQETLSTQRPRSHPPAQVYQPRQENKASVLPCQQSNTQGSEPSSAEHGSGGTDYKNGPKL